MIAVISRLGAVADPNSLLRAARERTRSNRAPGAGMSRSELAEDVCAWLWRTTGERYSLDAHYVAKLERGVVRRPREAYRAALRHVLNAATDGDLGFAASAPAPAIADHAAATSVRRPHSSSIDVEAVLMDSADESATWLSFAEASNVGDLTVEQLHADVWRIAGAYLKAPTLPLFNRTRALRDRAFTLLQGHQRPAQTRDLYAAAGWSTTLLAWMTIDLGRPDVAESHARTARACAENADHDGLRAWVCATQHTAAFWQDDYARAAEYASEGLRYATGTATTFLASAYAMDLARSGRLDLAREALAMARNAATTAERGEDEMQGPFSCTIDRAAGLWADVCLALGDASNALALSHDAVTAFDVTADEERNPGSERMVRLQAARAHLMLGELDGAAESVGPVMATAEEHRVRPLIRRMADVHELAAAPSRAAEPITTGIRDGIAEFVRHPAIIN